MSRSSGSSAERLTFSDAPNQRVALAKLFSLSMAAVKNPVVRDTAIQMITDCDGRDDRCELQAVFDSIRNGNRNVPGFEHGVKYLTDPDIYDAAFTEAMDHYTDPPRLIKQCRQGICAEDCDGMSSLIVALTSALGFQAGLRIFKPQGSKYYEHVYAVVLFPKLAPDAANPLSGRSLIAMDTTVNYQMGWEPSGGEHLTAAVPNGELAQWIAQRGGN